MEIARNTNSTNTKPLNTLENITQHQTIMKHTKTTQTKQHTNIDEQQHSIQTTTYNTNTNKKTMQNITNVTSCQHI